VSEAFLAFFSKDAKLMNENFEFIMRKLKFCCPSMVFINGNKNIEIEGFVAAWVESFFFPISENGSALKEIILTYLFLQKFSKASVSRIC
jgi:hypothetical protein